MRLSSQTLADVFTYEVVDAGGLPSLATITVTIQGSNDAPIAVVDTDSATAGSNVSSGAPATGDVLSNDTDVDSNANGETRTVTGVVAGTFSSAAANVGSSVNGSYGSITINSDGSYTYNVDNNNSTVINLGTGQTVQDIFTYTMTDAGGLSSTTQLTITINGSNDAPVAVDDNADAIEASGVSNATAGNNPSGNVLTNDTDNDVPDTKTVVGVVAGASATVASGSVGMSVTGSYGTVNVASDGSYTYTVDNNNSTVQALRVNGQTVLDLFTYTIVDTAELIARRH